MEEYLYKYYSFDENEYSILNLENGKICFNNLNNFNDPFEGIGIFNFNKTDEEKGQFKGLEKRISEKSKEYINFYYRISCFTETYTNPLMWGTLCK